MNIQVIPEPPDGGGAFAPASPAKSGCLPSLPRAAPQRKPSTALVRSSTAASTALSWFMTIFTVAPVRDA